MNIILFSKAKGRARQLDLAHPLTLGVIAVLALGILGTAFALGIRLGERSGTTIGHRDVKQWAGILGQQKAQLAGFRNELQERIDAIAIRLGQMNAHVTRLDALGKQLTEMADIDNREFNFDSSPPLGGPEADAGDDIGAQIPDLTHMLDDLDTRMDLRDAQLNVLQGVILDRKLKKEIRPDGRPVKAGFISSNFGERADPFNGHEAFHKGVDFAGTAGADVVAVAAGVVTYAGTRAGYGSLVEINHGDGYVTRYGHNEKTVVTPGQTVARGELIALMGSTGRSTGPHVHFEVLRNGKQVNPAAFIGR